MYQNNPTKTMSFHQFESVRSIMIHDCYSAQGALTPNAFQTAINRLRIARNLRVLWPDHEVQDLIHAGIALTQLSRFTSTPIIILKTQNPEQLFEGHAAQGQFTHMAVQRSAELDDDLKKKDVFFVVLAKRGLAVDELASKFLRGSYIISAQVAQLQRQTCLWGVETISKGRHIITPKNISKGTSMWRIEFQSVYPLTNIFFYSTKREPRYGKASMHANQLPKDAKLELCMKFRTFHSYVDGMMNKQENILQNVPRFITPRKSQGIFFGSNAKENNKESGQQAKNEQISLNKFKIRESLSKDKEIRLKQLHHASILQINNLQSKVSIGLEIKQIIQFIDQKQKMVYLLLENDKQLAKIINNGSDGNLRSHDFDQLIKSLKQAQKLDHNQLRQYFMAILIHNFSESQQKTIENWVQIFEHADLLPQNEQKSHIIKWIEALMFQHCHELLKDCDQDLFESLQIHKTLIMRGIERQLANNSHQSSKVSDLLYIIMKLQGKKDIFDLYHNHQLTQNSILLTTSLKQWQQAHQLYLKNDADIIYQTQATFQLIHYHHQKQEKSQQKNTNQYDFSVIFSLDQFSKNAFFSGKQVSVGNHKFKYYITLKQGSIYCFIEKIEGLNSNKCEQTFTSFDIRFEITLNQTTKTHDIGWSFNSPSHSVGFHFLFNDFHTNSNLKCKISLKRAIIHESILNYLRVRFEQLLKMENKCSERIEMQNKKLLKRRSSLFLEKNLYDDVNFCNTIEQECFLHFSCGKCEALTKESSIFKLSPLDLYRLMLCASFKNELDAFLVTIKQLILTPSQISNNQFWLSQLRIDHLNLQSLLQLINKKRLEEDMLKIMCSLIDQKMNRNNSKLIFLHRKESRVGKGMWSGEEDDYSSQYLQFLDNVHKRQ